MTGKNDLFLGHDGTFCAFLGCWEACFQDCNMGSVVGSGTVGGSSGYL